MKHNYEEEWANIEIQNVLKLDSVSEWGQYYEIKFDFTILQELPCSYVKKGCYFNLLEVKEEVPSGPFPLILQTKVSANGTYLSCYGTGKCIHSNYTIGRKVSNSVKIFKDHDLNMGEINLDEKYAKTEKLATSYKRFNVSIVVADDSKWIPGLGTINALKIKANSECLDLGNFSSTLPLIRLFEVTYKDSFLGCIMNYKYKKDWQDIDLNEKVQLDQVIDWGQHYEIQFKFLIQQTFSCDDSQEVCDFDLLEIKENKTSDSYVKMINIRMRSDGKLNFCLGDGVCEISNFTIGQTIFFYFNTYQENGKAIQKVNFNGKYVRFEELENTPSSYNVSIILGNKGNFAPGTLIVKSLKIKANSQCLPIGK